MSVGRRMRVVQGLSLLARIAAARFAVRHRACPQRGEAWRPLVLRWRQRRKRDQHARIGPTVTPMTRIRQSIFHLHFSAFANQQSRPVPAMTTFSSFNRNLERLIVNHHWLDRLRAVAASLRFDRDGSVHSGEAVAPLAPAAHSASRLRRRGSLASRSVASVPTRADRQRLFERSIEVVRRISRDEQPSAMRARVANRALAFFGPVPGTARTRIRPALLIEHAAPAVPVRRPVDMVWRTSAVAASPSAIEDRRQSGSRAFVREQSKATEAPVAPVATKSAGVTPVVERAPLDPALLDRLTDDVIRRVERRVRIERERRGL